MGDVYAGGHELLNPHGHNIRVTQRTVRTLDMRGYLKRDRASGLKQIKPELIDVLAEMEYGSPLMHELGPDFSGPNVALCTCKECRRRESDADMTLTPAGRRLVAEQAVREVKARRPR